jgi:hypothetical protein
VCKSDAFSENDFIRLRKVYKSLADGMAKREDYFNIKSAEKSVFETDATKPKEDKKKDTKEPKKDEKQPDMFKGSPFEEKGDK